eukprot:gene1975-1983_t
MCSSLRGRAPAAATRGALAAAGLGPARLWDGAVDYFGGGRGGGGRGAAGHAAGLQRAPAAADEAELSQALLEYFPDNGEAYRWLWVGEVTSEFKGVMLRAKQQKWCAGATVAPLVGERLVQLHTLCGCLGEVASAPAAPLLVYTPFGAPPQRLKPGAGGSGGGAPCGGACAAAKGAGGAPRAARR